MPCALELLGGTCASSWTQPKPLIHCPFMCWLTVNMHKEVCGAPTRSQIVCKPCPTYLSEDPASALLSAQVKRVAELLCCGKSGAGRGRDLEEKESSSPCPHKVVLGLPLLSPSASCQTCANGCAQRGLGLCLCQKRLPFRSGAVSR